MKNLNEKMSSILISNEACGPVIGLTIEILFNITEATSIWAVDKCMNMLYPILIEKIRRMTKEVKIMLED